MIKTVVTITAASGGGKTTLEERLIELLGGGRVRTITTRQPRVHETSENYDFRNHWGLSFWRFLSLFWDTGYLWFVPIHGALYSVAEREFELAAAQTKGLAFVSITPERHEFVADYFGRRGVRSIAIHLEHPGEEELQRRLRARGESAEQIERRIVDSYEFERAAAKVPNLHVIKQGTPEEVLERVLAIITP